MKGVFTTLTPHPFPSLFFRLTSFSECSLHSPHNINATFRGKAQILLQIAVLFAAQKLHGSAGSHVKKRRIPASFWAANSTAICKRICAFPLNVAFILCGLCKEHSEKEVSRKNNKGKGCEVRVVKTPLMVLFNKGSFRILPVYQVLVNAMNGLFWQLLSTFEGLLPYGNAKWQRWDHQLEGFLSKKYFVHWLSWPLGGLKCPLRRTDSTACTMFILINSW